MIFIYLYKGAKHSFQ